MAKVTGPNQSPRAPSLRGAFLIKPYRGGFVAQAWPTKRPGKKSPRQQQAIDDFIEAAWVAKYAPAEDQMTARKLSHGSQFLPRDLQYMAIYGRLCSLFFTNGERRYQLASRIDLTELLDILGFKPGSLLFRGPDYWETVDPPSEPSILAFPADRPEWLTPGEAGAGGGAVYGATIFGNPIANQQNRAIAGHVITPRENLIMSAIQLQSAGASLSRTRRAIVAPVDQPGPNGVLTDLPILSQPIVYPDQAQRFYRFTFDEPVTLLSGQAYFIGEQTFLGNPPQGVDTRAVQAGTGGVSLNGPVTTHSGFHTFASPEPGIGTGYASTHTASIVVWIEAAIAG